MAFCDSRNHSHNFASLHAATYAWVTLHYDDKKASADITEPAGDLDFKLVNKTGVEIHKLFISPTKADKWQEDVLGEDTLADGSSLDIKFPPKETAEKWDLRIEASDGSAIEWTDLKLSDITTLTLHYDDKKATATIE